MTKSGLQCSVGGWLIEPDTMATMQVSALSAPRVEAGPNPLEMGRHVLAGRLSPVMICFSLDALRQVPDAVDAELGNEPDLHHANNPWPGTSYHDAIPEAIAIAQAKGLRLWLGAVSNPNNRGLRFLAQLPWDEIPLSVGCSHHWYPTPPNIDAGHDGRTQDEEVAAVKAVVGATRPLALTETGFHEGDFTPDQVLEGLRRRRAFAERHGYLLNIAYQLVDGPPEGTSRLAQAARQRFDRQHRLYDERVAAERFGFQTWDRVWKPARVEAWTGQPFVDGSAAPPPAVDDWREVTARLTSDDPHVEFLEPVRFRVRVTAAGRPPEPPLPPEPQDLTMLVKDSTGRPVVDYTVTPLGDNLHPAAQPKHVQDGNGFVHYPVLGATRFRFEAAGFVTLERVVTPAAAVPIVLERVPIDRPRREGAVTLG